MHMKQVSPDLASTAFATSGQACWRLMSFGSEEGPFDDDCDSSESDEEPDDFDDLDPYSDDEKEQMGSSEFFSSND